MLQLRLQQSALATQDALAAWHAQRPTVHSMEPQHSKLFVQVTPASLQQSDVEGVGRNDRPAQHVECCGLPAASQVEETHVVPLHVRPAQQFPGSVHAEADAPHAVATHVPPTELEHV